MSEIDDLRADLMIEVKKLDQRIKDIGRFAYAKIQENQSPVPMSPTTKSPMKSFPIPIEKKGK